MGLELEAVIPPKLKHENTGSCAKCKQIFDRYPGFHQQLRDWFKVLQKHVPTAHISTAGRGELDQEAAVRRGASRAHWGKSAHNWNCAMDFFEMGGSSTDIYERKWFDKELAPRIPDWIEWYGRPGASFPELPHCELKGWRQMAKDGKLHLVE